MLKLSLGLRKLAHGTALAGVVGLGALALSAAPVHAQRGFNGGGMGGFHGGMGGFHGGGFHGGIGWRGEWRGGRWWSPGWGGWRGGWWRGRWYGPGWGGWWGVGVWGWPYWGYPYWGYPYYAAYSYPGYRNYYPRYSTPANPQTAPGPRG